jgi:formate dehydrogenase major subunit
VPGLGASFGRGAATTPQWDLANSQCIVIMGVDMVENHPIAYRFVMQAKEPGSDGHSRRSAFHPHVGYI